MVGYDCLGFFLSLFFFSFFPGEDCFVCGDSNASCSKVTLVFVTTCNYLRCTRPPTADCSKASVVVVLVAVWMLMVGTIVAVVN